MLEQYNSFILATLGTVRHQIIQHSDYPTIPRVTKVLTGIFCYCSYTWALQIVIGVFPLFICCSFRVIRFHYLGTEGGGGREGSQSSSQLVYSDAEEVGNCGSGVFIAEAADGIGDKGTGNNTSVDVETSLVAFMEDFHTWGLFISCTVIRIIGGSAFRLMEFYCKWRL